MSTLENETPTPEAVEATKPLFAGNPSATDDALVAAIEAVSQMPAELAPTEAITAIEASAVEVETADEAPAEVETAVDAVVHSEPSEPEPASESAVPEAVVETSVEPAEPVAAEPVAVEADEAPVDPLDAMKAERAAIDKKIKAEQKAKRKAVLDQIVVVARNYEIPTKEIVDALGGLPSPSKGTKAPITHRDNKGNTWTGRGKTPKWLQGLNPDDYKV